MWFKKRSCPPLVRPFKLVSDYSSSGDQPQAIEKLSSGVDDGIVNQVLLGVTGSGKTFTMAKVIEKVQRPTIIMAHNKTLAAQLYEEMKGFFPENNVEYFVSFYDYYQPEAYVPRSDTYIEKDSSINEQIEQMRHSATRSVIEHGDTIIIASVSAIYGIGDAEVYSNMILEFNSGNEYDLEEILHKLTELRYDRSDNDFKRGSFRVRGDNLEIFPSHLENRAWRFDFFGDELELIKEFDPLTGKSFKSIERVHLYPNSHYVTPKPTIIQAIDLIKIELAKRIQEFQRANKLLEAQRIKERVLFDIEMLESTGYCNGIENYSRYLTGRDSGVAPPTLFEYLPENAVLFVDESHASIPQIRAMYNGDRARKNTLAEYGFRLPSCVDNRPLRFDEWQDARPQTIFVSATPSQWELEQAGNEMVEQLIRPTGLRDPICEVRPASTQVDDVLYEIRKQVEKSERTLVTTLTKKISEQLTEYLQEQGIKVSYMHSDVSTLDRIEIIRNLRLGVYDVLVGINLLREGLDIPECSLVAILDADKEGFLRNKTSLIQTIGRAARNENGRVLLYADKETASLRYALDETERRRTIQDDYNKKHNIVPKTIKRSIVDIIGENQKEEIIFTDLSKKLKGKSLENYIADLEKQMRKAAKELEFEKAIELRNQIELLQKQNLELNLNIGINQTKPVKQQRRKKK